MKSTIFLFSISLFLLISSQLCSAENEVIVPNSVRLPQDSNTVSKLLTSLESFLAQKDDRDIDNSFVNPSYLLETSLLLDELKQIGKSSTYKSDNFYKCYLGSVSNITDKQFLVQFSYIGVNDGEPLLRATYSVVATYMGDKFLFHSPLRMNTASWSMKNIGKVTIYYKPEFDIIIANDYVNYTTEFDNILGVSDKPTILYCANNFNEVMKLIGVDYKLDYSGINFNTTSAFERDTTIIVNGVLASNVIQFDPHDLWHSRLRAVLAPNDTYKPVDEGCAFLFGGSWGYSWDEIRNRFYKFTKTQVDRDWLSIHEKHPDIGDEKGKALRVDYIINALIIKELYKDGDFSKVKQLLSIGREQTNLDVYFKNLDEVIGINKDNFNEKIDKLIVKYVGN
jgi:hypothetical protein